MKYLKLDIEDIPYVVAKKSNKNTYFYFKKEGYIQINLSKYQTEKEVLKYMKKHQNKFIEKLQKNTKKQSYNENEFLIKGQVYEIVLDDVDQVVFVDNTNKVYLPTTDIKNPVIKGFYKHEMLDQIHQLHQKYLANKSVDISGVKYRTQYTNSRHGSCNARLRNVNLNLHLIKYDIKFIEYVYLHEIAHLKYQNHSSKFYDLLFKLCPNYKELRKELRNIYR